MSYQYQPGYGQQAPPSQYGAYQAPYPQQQAYQQPYAAPPPGAPRPGAPPPGAPPPYQAPPQTAYQPPHAAQAYGQPGGYAPSSQAPVQQPGGYSPMPQQQQQQGGIDPTVANWFQSIDSDRTGTIDSKELLRALAMGNMHYSISDADHMVRAFDTKGSRSLNLTEFGKLHAFLTSVTASFNYFDTTKRGALNEDSLSLALRHAGFSMDPPVIKVIFRRHDPDNTNSLSLDEYIRMCLFLQSCVRTFGAFDSQQKGTISLDFNQFVYAAGHV